MTAKEIIALGEKITVPGDLFLSQIWLILICGGIWIIGGLLTIGINETVNRPKYNKTLEKWISALGFAGIIVANIFVIHMFDSGSDNYLAETTEWKEESAYPYIQTLDSIDLELVSIEKAEYPREHDPEHIIKYRNAEQIVETLNSPENNPYDKSGGNKAYTLVYDVPTGEKPFVRFYMLGEDLGHGVGIGGYPLTIHLNEK